MSNNPANDIYNIRTSTFLVGIDPGVHTGMCIYDRRTRRIDYLATTGIAECMHRIKELADRGVYICVMIEDARKRSGPANKALGAGSVRRDCSVWQEWLDWHKIPSVWQNIGTTKMTSEQFAKLTGYRDRTSSHARDAAMIVWGR